MLKSIHDKVNFQFDTATKVLEATPRKGDFEHENDPMYFREELPFGAIPQIRQILETCFSNVYQLAKHNIEMLATMYFYEVQDALQSANMGNIKLNEVAYAALMQTARDVVPLWEAYCIDEIENKDPSVFAGYLAQTMLRTPQDKDSLRTRASPYDADKKMLTDIIMHTACRCFNGVKDIDAEHSLNEMALDVLTPYQNFCSDLLGESRAKGFGEFVPNEQTEYVTRIVAEKLHAFYH